MNGRAALCLVGLALLLALAPGAAPAGHVEPAVGHRAPDFTLPDLHGRPVQLSKVLRTKAVFLNFWATWCVPCREEMPMMERAYREYRGHGLEMLAVSLDSGPKDAVVREVSKFMAELGLSFPALLDPEWEAARRYRLFGIPTTVLVDRRGIVRAFEVGPRDWFAAESRRKLEQLLGEK